MQKTSPLLITLTFALGCLGLWSLLGVLLDTCQHKMGSGDVPGLTGVCLELRSWLLVLPVPWLAFSLFLLFRGRMTTEAVLAYAAVLAFLFIFILLTLAVAFLPGLALVLIISVPLFTASVLCFYRVPFRWMRILVVLSLGLIGFVLLGAALWGVAMGSGHGSYHGPSAEELGDTYIIAWPILVLIALYIAWRERPFPLHPLSDGPASATPRLKTLRELSRGASNNEQPDVQ